MDKMKAWIEAAIESMQWEEEGEITHNAAADYYTFSMDHGIDGESYWFVLEARNKGELVQMFVYWDRDIPLDRRTDACVVLNELNRRLNCGHLELEEQKVRYVNVIDIRDFDPGTALFDSMYEDLHKSLRQPITTALKSLACTDLSVHEIIQQVDLDEREELLGTATVTFQGQYKREELLEATTISFGGQLCEVTCGSLPVDLYNQILRGELSAETHFTTEFGWLDFHDIAKTYGPIVGASYLEIVDNSGKPQKLALSDIPKVVTEELRVELPTYAAQKPALLTLCFERGGMDCSGAKIPELSDFASEELLLEVLRIDLCLSGEQLEIVTGVRYRGEPLDLEGAGENYYTKFIVCDLADRIIAPADFLIGN